MAQMTGPRLEMRSIVKRFGATVALAGVDFAVDAGQVHAIVGENGAGKSTLMKVLSGAIGPDRGDMLLDGRPFRPRHPLDARRAGVAMIYQELSLCDHLTVGQNIVLGVEPGRRGLVDSSKTRRIADAALEELGHRDLDPQAVVGRLTIAQRQLVEIARAIACDCKVLVLDEPTSSLNRSDVHRLFALIGRLKARGRAIVYISHYLEEVQEVADRLTVLRDGRSAGSGRTAQYSPQQIVAMMVGRRIEQLFGRSTRQSGQVVLELDDLAGAVKPQSAGLQLRRGEVLGIAGLVGSGRTEMLRALFGLDPVRRGRIKLGTCIGPASPLRRWQQGAGMLSEDRQREGLAASMSLADNLTLSRMGTLLSPTHLATQAGQWIERMGIRCLGARQRVGDLSGGNQQKVALARLLHHDVDVLLLDEPTRGIDVASKAQIYELIDALAGGAAGHKPKAVLMVSSYLPELLGVCDRVAVMYRGRLGEAKPVSQLDEHALMLEATGQSEVA